MKIKDLFENSLMELRRNPTVNFKQSYLESLKKYAGREDIFISFTSDVGKKSHGLFSPGIGVANVSGHKIGINPRTKYDTPIGIYAYPVDYVLDLKGKVPFADKEHFIQVLELASDDIIDLEAYTWDDFDKDSEKLIEYLKDFRRNNDKLFQPPSDANKNQLYFDKLKQIKRFNVPENIINSAVSDSNVKTPGGALWNATRMVANRITKSLRSDFQSKRLTENAITLWNKIFRMLGYDGAVDYGKGIIHENEPTQAIFFSIKSIKLVETLRNIQPQVPKSNTLIAMENPRLFFKWLYAGKLNMFQISTILQNTRSIVSLDIEWHKLPDFVKKSFQHNYKKWIMDNSVLFSIIPLTDEQRIELIQEKPILLAYRTSTTIYSPRVVEFLAEHFFDKNLERIIDEMKYRIPFTPQQILNILNKCSHLRLHLIINSPQNPPNWCEGIKLFSKYAMLNL